MYISGLKTTKLLAQPPAIIEANQKAARVLEKDLSARSCLDMGLLDKSPEHIADSDKPNEKKRSSPTLCITTKHRIGTRAAGVRRLTESRLTPSGVKSETKPKLRKVTKAKEVEVEESPESIETKAAILAQLIRDSKQAIIYTGAGISTSASIPDYRGPNGLWTQKRKTGTVSITRQHDLTLAKPTPTHMAIRELCRRRIVKHVVSQNCDGLHIRSGIPQTQLSEIHGNMYIEICQSCERQYFRQGDTTDKTARFRHKTGRKCHSCKPPNNELKDSIVLYGERSRSDWPMNWHKATRAAEKADLIICIGSSLKTLRLYKCLWPKSLSRIGGKEPTAKLVVVNLQYTSKDRNAAMKIVAKCDQVMEAVMRNLDLNLPEYDHAKDPLRRMAVQFTPDELSMYKRNLIFDVADEANELDPSERCLEGAHSSRGQSPSEDPEYRKKASPVVGSDSHLTLNDENVNSTDNSQLSIVKREAEASVVKEYTLPNWLSKGLGHVKSNCYKRKRRTSRKARSIKSLT